MVRTFYVLAIALALTLTPSAPAQMVAPFPGVEALIEKSDAIVILRIEREVQPKPGDRPLAAH